MNKMYFDFQLYGVCSGFYDNHIFRKSFNSIPIGQHNRNGNMTGFPGFNISYGTRFSRMNAADYLALRPIHNSR